MKSINNYFIAYVFGLFVFAGCQSPQQLLQTEDTNMPSAYVASSDTSTIATLSWKTYFDDENLVALIETAVNNNKELQSRFQEIIVHRANISAKKGEYLPSLGIVAGAGLEKEGRYTRHGAVDESVEIKHGKAFPEPLTDLMVGAIASWEVDIWKKLRNEKKAAVERYLASVEGRNFVLTQIISEIAESYYELMSLDNQLQIVKQNIEIQNNALRAVRQQKESAKVTQLAVNRFEAQWLNTQNLQYDIQQQIVEVENKINFLLGRFPQPIARQSSNFLELSVTNPATGIPSQLLANRPDIRQAEYALAAAKLDVKSARANFYPSLGIKAGIGFQAFQATYLFEPKSILYNLAGDLVAPLVNRNAIKALYQRASAEQLQKVVEYEQSILQGYVDVINQLSKVEKYASSYSTKSQEVALLMQSVNIANSLFSSARADYAEVLMTQREALESKMELIEIKKKQLAGKVHIYRALGGGWK
jgi:multidrug efflux system outer membrane protein